VWGGFYFGSPRVPTECGDPRRVACPRDAPLSRWIVWSRRECPLSYDKLNLVIWIVITARKPICCGVYRNSKTRWYMCKKEHNYLIMSTFSTLILFKYLFIRGALPHLLWDESRLFCPRLLSRPTSLKCFVNKLTALTIYVYFSEYPVFCFHYISIFCLAIRCNILEEF